MLGRRRRRCTTDPVRGEVYSKRDISLERDHGIEFCTGREVTERLADLHLKGVIPMFRANALENPD